jgi:hypothetical protein
MPARGSIVVLVFMVCAISAFVGRKRRQSGRLTPRDYIFAGSAAWALTWLWIGLPSLADWGSHMPWSEIMRAAAFLFSLAFFPLTLAVLATWLPRLFGSADYPGKKAISPHLEVTRPLLATDRNDTLRR